MPDIWRGLIEKIPLPRVVTLIGAGGKTTLMYYLVDCLLAAGISAVATATTKLSNQPPPHGRLLRVQSLEEALAKEIDWTAPQETTTVVLGEDAKHPEKLIGLPPDWIDKLTIVSPDTVWIVEGDGAAGRSLKGHQAYEPVIPATSLLVITVIGIDSIRQPLDSSYVHRPKRVAELIDVEPTSIITEELIAQLFFHPKGYLQHCPPDSLIVPFINKVESQMAEACAQRLTKLILAERRPNLPGVMLGSLHEERFWFIPQTPSQSGG